MGKKKKKKRLAFLKKHKKRKEEEKKGGEKKGRSSSDSQGNKAKKKQEKEELKTSKPYFSGQPSDDKEGFLGNKKGGKKKRKPSKKRKEKDFKEIFGKNFKQLRDSWKKKLISRFPKFNKHWWLRPWKAGGYWSWALGLVWGVTIALILVFINGAIFYWINPLESLSEPGARFVPYPVAWMDGSRKIVDSRELLNNTAALKKFYQSQDYASIGLRVDFSTPQGKKKLKVKEKDVLDKLIENKLLQIVAQEKGIRITTAEAQEALEKSIEESGNQRSLELNLEMLYGWDLEDFRDQVVLNQLYQEKLFEYYVGNIRESQAYREALEIQKQLQSGGGGFSQLAQEHSEGESAKNGGELGWFSRGQLIGQVGEVAFSLEKGEISQVIISELGFHIIQVQDKRTVKRKEGINEEGVSDKEGVAAVEEKPDSSSLTKEKTEEVKLRQIFIRNQSFLDWIKKEKGDIPVSKFECVFAIRRWRG
jgi:parvulin-like peptidyl-prolyl isomerase